MSTTNQLIRDGRKEKQRTDRTRALNKCPQKEGVCLRVLTRTPKKPNSALRKIAKVHLTNKHAIFAYIPGEGHNLQEHSKGGGRVKDSPGAKLIGAGAATIALAGAAIGMENIFSSFIHSNATLPKEVFWVALFLNSLWLVYKFVPTRKGSEVEEQLLLLVVGWLYWIMVSSFLSIDFSLLLISMSFGSAPTSQEIPFISMMEGAGNGSGSSGLASSGEEGVSSDGSLTAFRQTINIESEQNLFRRIRLLENQGYHNLPPQLNEGEYAALVSNNLDQAGNVDEYRRIYDRESNEVSVFELFGSLEHQLVGKILTESGYEEIARMIDKEGGDIREAAADFIKKELGDPLDMDRFQDLQALQPRAEELIQQVQEYDKNAPFYRRFFADLTDEQVRRNCDLPLPPKD